MNAFHIANNTTKIRFLTGRDVVVMSLIQYTETAIKVAVKIQYPGVAGSIGSDIDNLQSVLSFARLLPDGLFVDSIMEYAKKELAQECDYVR